MDGGDGDDDKTLFDTGTAENVGDAQDGDAQPDPDEHLMLDQGNGRVWLVKIPKFLMERWSSINVEDAHLATLRVYSASPNGPPRKPRIILFLPPNQDPSAPPTSIAPASSHRPSFDHTTAYPSSGAEPEWYELDMVNDAVENQIVVAERPKDSSLSTSTSAAAATSNSRARTTILTGRIKHECNLRPAFSQSYRRQMRERHLKYNTPMRQIRMIEDAGVMGGRGGINRLSSGVGMGAGPAFGDFTRSKQKPVKGSFERMARIARNQLLDQLFVIFRDAPRWSVKVLRDKTQQPESYLKEVLSEIAILNRSGEYNGLWELKDIFKDPGVKGEHVGHANVSFEDSKMNIEDDDDDDDDDDMEEVS